MAKLQKKAQKSQPPKKPRKPQKETITFRIDVENKALLDEAAQEMDRDRSYVINEAVVAYLDLYRWQVEDVKKGIAEADAGQFVSEEEVQKTFSQWMKLDEN